jgi:hypothetical protein
MPSKKKKPGPTFGRNVAPFAPLALSLVMGALMPGTARNNVSEATVATETEAATCSGDIMDFRECHSKFPTGCSPSAGYDPYLNLLKNQLTPPPVTPPAKILTEADYKNLDAGTPSGLSGKNHAQFKDDLAKLGEGKTFGVIGYLYYAKASGAESSNCELDSKGDPEATDVDFHIGIGFNADDAKSVLADPTAKGPMMKHLEQTSVIVEMTPQYRFSFDNNIWTLKNVKSAVGHQVKVVGQLMADSEHNVPKDNCALGVNQTCWRGSVWELHPVMRFQVCGKDNCTADSPDADWVELDKLTSPAETKTTAGTGHKPAKPKP